jgi:hypothetical protein
MCMLTYAPPGATPAREHLLNGARLNPHGSGGAILVDGTGLLSVRCMDGDKAADLWLDMRQRFPDSHALFHSRYATADNVTDDNIQPVTRLDGLAVAHNGYLFPVDGDRSDTRVFAEELLPRWNLDAAADRSELELVLGAGNKLVILSADADHAEPAYILNEEHGHWHKGSWYSNTDYHGGEGHRAADIRRGVCGVCGRLAATRAAGGSYVCLHCQSLADQRYGWLSEGASG